jgi:hypothetical protein
VIHEHEGGLAVLPPHLLGVVLHASLTQNQFYNCLGSGSGSHGSPTDFVLLEPDPDPGAIKMKKLPAIQKIVYLPKYTSWNLYPYVVNFKCENFNLV